MGKLLPQTIEVDNCPCFAYTEELLSGNDLSSVINFNANKPADESEVKRLLRCLVSAVQTLWRDHRVVHRDIKPANVFATRDPARPYVLIDLGIAYDVSVPGLTLRKTDIPHTPLYMAPEMLSADFRETMSYRSDLYAAGLCAYEYAAGVHPLAKQGDDLRRTYTRVIHQEPTPLQQLRPDLSPDFCQLIDQLLKKSPSLRPANMNLILNQIA
jgi:serine/threonine-protein kinase